MNKFLEVETARLPKIEALKSPYYCSYNKIILKLYNDSCSNFDPSYIYIYTYIYVLFNIIMHLFLPKFYKTKILTTNKKECFCCVIHLENNRTRYFCIMVSVIMFLAFCIIYIYKKNNKTMFINNTH